MCIRDRCFNVAVNAHASWHYVDSMYVYVWNQHDGVSNCERTKTFKFNVEEKAIEAQSSLANVRSNNLHTVTVVIWKSSWLAKTTIAQSPKKFESVSEPSTSPVLKQISQISTMANFDLVDLKVKVLQVNPPCTVPTGKLKQDLTVADSIGWHFGEMK